MGLGSPEQAQKQTGCGRSLGPAWMQDPEGVRSAPALGDPRGSGESVPRRAQASLWVGSCS